jgi:3-deoxy-D-manno-octulosonic-acid transferase
MADLKLRLMQLSGRALARLITTVEKTSTVIQEPADLLDRLKATHPCIVAGWHGQFMLLKMFRPEGVRVAAMVARHGDAEVIGEAMHRHGVELIRGAGAGGRKRDRGGFAALRASVKALGEGASLVMTADIPPGPARVAGDGIIMIARLSGRPIVPVAAASSRFRSFDTWSRLVLNLPYSTIALVAGEPIFVPSDASSAVMKEKRHELDLALNDAMAKAYHLAGADMRRAIPLDQLAALEPPPPGLALKAYSAAMSALRPAAPVWLGMRDRKGKEDPKRRGERLGFAGRPRPDGQLVWVHAASVGETNAVLPLIEAILRERPSAHVMLTTGTTTSATLAAQRLPERAFHQFVPLDAPAYARRFLDHWKPDLAIFTESDVWPNLVLATAGRTIPLVLVNARMSPRSQKRWRRNAGIGRVLFSRFNLILAQNVAIARTLKRLGAPHVITTGNLKIDSPPPPVDSTARDALQAATEGRTLFLAASTHNGEEATIANAHLMARTTLPSLLTIIAPRHPERGAQIANTLSSLGLTSVRRSLGEMPSATTDIYIADTIGELGTLYALSPVAFIGGSLIPHGGQNPIEAVQHGAAILTGPHTHNFRDAYAALIGEKAVEVVTDASALAKHIVALSGESDAAASRRAAADAAMRVLGGALEKSMAALRPFLQSPGS